MNRVLLFAGTTEGRRIAAACRGRSLELHVSVATEYGKTLIEPAPNIHVTHGRKDAAGILELLRETGAELVLDATHPYAAEVTAALRSVCLSRGVEYLRVLRNTERPDDICIFKDSTADIVEYLNSVQGNILLTVGSKELAGYTKVSDFENRVFARILSLPEAVRAAFGLGFAGRRLICMQGPFSEELNTALLRSLDIRYLVTKDTGAEGGFPEKIRAAKALGVTPIVLRRPCAETGVSVEECLRELEKRFGISLTDEKEAAIPADEVSPPPSRVTIPGANDGDAVSPTPARVTIPADEVSPTPARVTILGAGPGDMGSLTLAAEKACQKAGLIIGSKRICEALARFGKPTVAAVDPREIEALIRGSGETNIVVAMSGDTGFFSGAKGLTERIADLHPALIPGISSVSYFCSRVGTSWDDAVLASLHGRSCNIAAKIRESEKVIVLTGGPQGVRRLAEHLSSNALGSVLLTVGENLSYENEKITTGKASDICQMDFDGLSLVLAQNPRAASAVTSHGRPDEDFVRAEKIPMTKQEVRAVLLSKLRLTKNAVCWDVGAGTGSVSLEMAECCEDGEVYAVEQKEEACRVIEENKCRLGVTNVTVVRGIAPACLAPLPAPTHVFIGGSGGNLKDILAAVLEKSPEARIAVSAVTLETIAEAAEAMNALPLGEVETVLLSVSRSKKLGGYHLLAAQNPVYIFSCKGNGPMHT